MSLVGYAHVNTVVQSLDVQLGKLAHCHKFFRKRKAGPRISVRA